MPFQIETNNDKMFIIITSNNNSHIQYEANYDNYIKKSFISFTPQCFVTVLQYLNALKYAIHFLFMVNKS